MLDDRPCAPVRILAVDGQFTPEASEEIRQRYAAPRDYVEPPKPVYLPEFNGSARSPVSAVKDRVAHAAKRVGRPRVRPAKPKPHAGRGFAWNRNDGVTVEHILELQKQGKTAREIGVALGCDLTTVYGRLRNWRRESPERSQQDDALRQCPTCPRRKWATREKCIRCAQRERGER